MNAREKLMVSRLLTRIVEQPDAPKDPEAELEVAALLKVRPDAPYLLLQRVLMLEAALEQVQAQRAATAPPAASPTAAASRPAELVPPPTVWSAGSATPPLPSAPATPAAPGFLRQAATIGAGVLGGSLLFQGIESLLHGGSGHGLLSGGSPAPVNIHETVNNFIESPDIPQGGRDAAFERLDDGFLADGVGFDDDGSDLI